MPAIAAVAAQVAAAPKPVLCFDTCDVLEVVQCLHYEKFGSPRTIACIEPVRRLLDALAANPDRVQLVITELVATEWNQNIVGIRTKAEQHLAHIDDAVMRLHEAAGYVGTAMAASPAHAGGTLVADLVVLSQALLKQALRLDLDGALIQRALNRVYAKTRPSHDGHVKDSIHLEHYLEIARQLRALHFADHCIFVSGNRRDFWDGETSRLHPALSLEFADAAINLRFFGSIQAALGFFWPSNAIYLSAVSGLVSAKKNSGRRICQPNQPPLRHAAPPQTPPPEVKKRFRELSKQWKEGTAHLSSTARMAKHPAYREIIQMGPSAVPLLLANLRRDPDFWFAALREITGENPVPARRKFLYMFPSKKRHQFREREHPAHKCDCR